MRVALIGYGLAGRCFHAPLIASCQDLELVSVVSSNPERGRQVAREHPTARVVDRPESLWERDDHDVIVVATPNATHGALATAAIEHGCAVVVDKPLAVSSAEAETLIETASGHGVLLTVFQNRRWDSDHLTLRRLIDEGRLGRVLRYESRFERWRPSPDAAEWRSSAPEAGGGQLLDLGSHLVDQALSLFGPVSHVYGEVASLRGLPADDDAFLALRHHSGTISHLRVSAVTAAPGPRLRVLGSRAALLISALDAQEDRLRAGERPSAGRAWGVEPPSAWGRLVAGDTEEPVERLPGAWPEFYRRLALAVRGQAEAPVDPRDGLAVLRVLEMARASAESGSVIAAPAAG